MRKLGTWLGVVAIALQLAWPLLVSAKPRSVTLVPLCTLDGVTHSLEVPAGKTPLDASSAHRDHCPLCYLGHAPALLPHSLSPVALGAASGDLLSAFAPFSPKPVILTIGARAPPSPFSSAV